MFVKALYEADMMRLQEKTLGRLVWHNAMPNHHGFKEFLRKIAEKLEKAKFPYRVIDLVHFGIAIVSSYYCRVTKKVFKKYLRGSKRVSFLILSRLSTRKTWRNRARAKTSILLRWSVG